MNRFKVGDIVLDNREASAGFRYLYRVEALIRMSNLVKVRCLTPPHYLYTTAPSILKLADDLTALEKVIYGL